MPKVGGEIYTDAKDDFGNLKVVDTQNIFNSEGKCLDDLLKSSGTGTGSTGSTTGQKLYAYTFKFVNLLYDAETDTYSARSNGINTDPYFEAFFEIISSIDLSNDFVEIDEETFDKYYVTEKVFFNPKENIGIDSGGGGKTLTKWLTTNLPMLLGHGYPITSYNQSRILVNGGYMSSVAIGHGNILSVSISTENITSSGATTGYKLSLSFFVHIFSSALGENTAGHTFVSTEFAWDGTTVEYDKSSSAYIMSVQMRKLS